MAGKIPREFVDDLLSRTDIVELIDDYVQLKQSGNNYKARCPFHSEKTPSFTVNRQKQFYHCFGCGESGNAISFLMAYNHLSFPEAIEDLALLHGLAVPNTQSEYSKADNRSQALYQTLEKVAIYYVEQLRNNPEARQAITYLKQRGLSGAIAKHYSLGFAPDNWNNLTPLFGKQNLLESGLLIEKENGHCYDRFRGRLIFPIKDKRKRIIGFGGRVLDQSLPKYLNSPETTVFSKSNQVYGLSELLEHQAKPKTILIVEGYMDVLMLAQHQIFQAVASLGTAITGNHLELLFRHCSTLTLCLDGDTAGQNAAWKAITLAFSHLKDGRSIKIITLPESDDPDSFIQKSGKPAFQEKIENAQPLSDYFFEKMTDNMNLSNLEDRSLLISNCRPILQQIPEGIYKEMMLEKMNSLAQKKNTSANTQSLQSPAISIKPHKKSSPITPERAVLALLLQNPNLAYLIYDLEPNWKEMAFPSKQWLIELLEDINHHQPENTGQLLEIYRNSPKKHQTWIKLINLEIVPTGNPDFDIEAELKGAINHVFRKAKKNYFQASLKKLTSNSENHKPNT